MHQPDSKKSPHLPSKAPPASKIKKPQPRTLEAVGKIDLSTETITVIRRDENDFPTDISIGYQMDVDDPNTLYELEKLLGSGRVHRTSTGEPVSEWRKVKGPKRWEPEPGDSLIGNFVGTKAKEGPYGGYQVIYVATDSGTYRISGVQLTELFEGISPGVQVKIVFLGMKPVGSEGEMREFELYVR
jgi:hypothetical protein